MSRLKELCNYIIEAYIPDDLSGKVHFVEKNGADIWNWAEIAYEFAKNR